MKIMIFNGDSRHCGRKERYRDKNRSDRRTKLQNEDNDDVLQTFCWTGTLSWYKRDSVQ